MGAFDLDRFIWPDVAQGRQPQSATKSDGLFNHVFTPGLSDANLRPFGGRLSLAPPGVSIVKEGVAANYISSAQTTVLVTPGTSDRPRVLVWQGYFLGAGNNYAPVGLVHGSDNSGNNLYLQLINSTLIGCFERNNYGTINQTAVTAASVVNVPITVVYNSLSQTDHRIYAVVNGVLLTATTTTDIGAPSGVFVSLTPSFSSASADHKTTLFAYGTDRLTDEQCIRIALDPWRELVKPQGISFPSGAITVPTLSAATMTGITSTGGYPQVTRA